MTRRSGSSGGDFNDLLAWLHPDRETAAGLYEEVRRNLIQLFARNGCHDPEGMADETIARVTDKVLRLAETFEGQPALFFYGVAKKQLLEYARQRNVPLAPQHEPSTLPTQHEEQERDDSDERLHDCFEQCLSRLKPEERELMLRYYEGTGQAKIDSRKQLAEERGIGLNALRVRVLRIRAGLRARIEKCLGEGGLK
jgi:RNA polymerase sigma factor (sigma-70 family)